MALHFGLLLQTVATFAFIFGWIRFRLDCGPPTHHLQWPRQFKFVKNVVRKITEKRQTSASLFDRSAGTVGILVVSVERRLEYSDLGHGRVRFDRSNFMVDQSVRISSLSLFAVDCQLSNFRSRIHLRTFGLAWLSIDIQTKLLHVPAASNRNLASLRLSFQSAYVHRLSFCTLFCGQLLSHPISVHLLLSHVRITNQSNSTIVASTVQSKESAKHRINDSGSKSNCRTQSVNKRYIIYLHINERYSISKKKKKQKTMYHCKY